MFLIEISCYIFAALTLTVASSDILQSLEHLLHKLVPVAIYID